MSFLVFVRILTFSSLIAVAIQGCGDGSGSAVTSVSTAVSNTVPVAKETGAITFSLKRNPTDLVAKTVGSSTLPTPTNIRVIVSNTDTGFKAIQDVAVSSITSVTIPVPVGTGYTVDAISYVLGNGKQILKYNNASGISVSTNVNTPVNIILQPISVSITPPNTVVAGNSFNLSFTKPSELFGFNCLNWGDSLITTASIQPTGANMVYGNQVSLNAPTETASGNLYFQMVFFINSNFLNSNELGDMYNWYFYYPNPTYGDTPVSMPYTLPGGGISLGITY